MAGLAAQISYAQEFKVGAPVADFGLRDMKGGAVNYSDLKGKVTVVIFIATECPVSNAYNQRMNELYGALAGRVNFIFVNSNATESAEKMCASTPAKSDSFFPSIRTPTTWRRIVSARSPPRRRT